MPSFERLTGYGANYTNFYGLAERLKASTNWRMGTLRGESGRGPRTHGELPEEFHASVRYADYVVYSYDTPIAWRSGGKWVQPYIKYSPTTTRHQGRIEVALSVLDKV